MTNTETREAWHRYKDAISSSARLLQQDKYDEALKVVDEALSEAIGGEEISWIRTLSHHAAVIAYFKGDTELMKSYYQKSLAHDPENARALYGLASVARKQGETNLANQYATRCYRAIVRANNGIARRGLLDLLLKHWPKVGNE